MLSKIINICSSEGKSRTDVEIKYFCLVTCLQSLIYR